jgi:integrase
MSKRSKTRGLQLRGDIWHMDKVVLGIRICGSTETSDEGEAANILACRIADIRAQKERGVRPIRTFRQAATKYLNEFGHKRSIADDADALKDLDPFIGGRPISEVHWETLRPYREARAHLAAGTVNRRVAVVKLILTLCARLWRHPNGMTWLEVVPLIPDVVGPKREPYPLDWDEQGLLFSELAAHLAEMATFKVNTGTREDEVCQLLWAWEHKLPGLCSVFVIPPEFVKNTRGVAKARVVICNESAQAIVEARRAHLSTNVGRHALHVFTYTPPPPLDKKGNPTATMLPAPVDRINTSGWRAARRRAAERHEKELGRTCPTGFRRIRVHDLKHTFGRRLRAAGVNFEDRQDLLGHSGGRITTHYSVAEIANLLKAANLVNESRKSHTANLLRVVSG